MHSTAHESRLLRFSDSRWLARLRLGVGMILLAVGVIVLTGLAVGLMFTALRWAVARDVTLIIAAGGGVIAYASFLAGSWLLTSPEPDARDDKRLAARRLTRVALLVGALDMLFQLAGAVTRSSVRVGVALEVASALAAVVTVVGVFAQLSYLADLARRLPDERLARHFSVLKYGLGISYLVQVVLRTTRFVSGSISQPASFAMMTMMAAGLLMVIFAVLYLLSLLRFSAALREEIRQTKAPDAID